MLAGAVPVSQAFAERLIEPAARFALSYCPEYPDNRFGTRLFASAAGQHILTMAES